MNDAIMGAANELFAAVLLAVIAYAAVLARGLAAKAIAKMDSAMDDEAKARIEAAIENAIALAEKRSSAVTLPQVMDYVKNLNPQDLKRFGMDANPEKLAVKVASVRAAKEVSDAKVNVNMTADQVDVR